MDKVMSKRIFETNGVPTPRWKLLPHDGPADGSDADRGSPTWPLPCVVKPANEGSSVGVVDRRGSRAARRRGRPGAQASTAR